MARPIRVQSLIRAPPASVREHAQEPEKHVQWDLRFTGIEYLPREEGGPQRFRYATRMGGIGIDGWGETVADRDDRGSGLRFGSDNRLSLIREGAGSWRYDATDDGTMFSTIYDYRTRGGPLGKLLDVVFRPAMAWATRWSFDRLRLHIEGGTGHALLRDLWLLKRAAAVLLGLVWMLAGLLPKIRGPRPEEIDLVAGSGLGFGAPEATLAALGWAEVALGAWLIFGWAERGAVAVATIGMLVLAGLVMVNDPDWWTDPYSGVVKNLGLLGCALVVWFLSPVTPKASRARARGTP